MISKLKKGFSLVELLVVIAIIGILAAVGITAYQGYTTGAKEKAVLANQKQIVSLINSEFAKCAGGSGFYPWGAYTTGTRSGAGVTWAANDDCDRNSTLATSDPSDHVALQVSAKAIADYINFELEMANPWNNTDTTIAIALSPTQIPDPDGGEGATMTDVGWADTAADVGRMIIGCSAAVGGGGCIITSRINKAADGTALSTPVNILYY